MDMNRQALLLSIVITLLLVPIAFAQRTSATTRSSRDHIRTAETLAALQANLKSARRLLADVRDRSTREQLEVLLSRAALQADDLSELLGDAATDRHRTPISEADFSKLLDTIKDQSFDDDKVEFIKTFAKGRPLSSDQVKSILKTMSFDDGRTQVAILLYPSVTDPENFFDALKILPFESSRKQVMEAVRKGR